jgi:hypothetical protein
MKASGRKFTVIIVWIGVETFFAPVGFYVFWHIPWQTAFQKAFYGLVTIAFYFCVIAFMFCRVSFLWLRWGAARYEAQRARARSLPLVSIPLWWCFCTSTNCHCT